METLERKYEELRGAKGGLRCQDESAASSPPQSAPASSKETLEEKLARLETEMQENLAEAGDRTNFMFGTYGKKMSSFEGVDLYEKAIKFNGKAWAISGAEISMEMGALKSRMTLTRIGTGALFFSVEPEQLWEECQRKISKKASLKSSPMTGFCD